MWAPAMFSLQNDVVQLISKIKLKLARAEEEIGAIEGLELL